MRQACAPSCNAQASVTKSFAEGYRRFSEERGSVHREVTREDLKVVAKKVSFETALPPVEEVGRTHASQNNSAGTVAEKNADESESEEDDLEQYAMAKRETTFVRQDTQKAYRAFLARQKSVSLEVDVHHRKSRLLDGVSALSQKLVEDVGLEPRVNPRKSANPKARGTPPKRCEKCTAYREQLQALKLEQKALESALKARTLLSTASAQKNGSSTNSSSSSHRRKSSSSSMLSSLYSGPARLPAPPPPPAIRSVESSPRARQFHEDQSHHHTKSSPCHSHHASSSFASPPSAEQTLGSSAPAASPAKSSSSTSVRLLRQEVENLRTTADFLFHQLENVTRDKNNAG